MNPDKSFVFVFQTTKDGKFRGANTFQHDVDSVVAVPEKVNPYRTTDLMLVERRAFFNLSVKL